MAADAYERARAKVKSKTPCRVRCRIRAPADATSHLRRREGPGPSNVGVNRQMNRAETLDGQSRAGVGGWSRAQLGVSVAIRSTTDLAQSTIGWRRGGSRRRASAYEAQRYSWCSGRPSSRDT